MKELREEQLHLAGYAASEQAASEQDGDGLLCCSTDSLNEVGYDYSSIPELVEGRRSFAARHRCSEELKDPVMAAAYLVQGLDPQKCDQNLQMHVYRIFKAAVGNKVQDATDLFLQWMQAHEESGLIPREEWEEVLSDVRIDSENNSIEVVRAAIAKG
eukprot:581722-Hanusia_phi.AAC.1